jgi:vancomycin permeability regulator SanA
MTRKRNIMMIVCGVILAALAVFIIWCNLMVDNPSASLIYSDTNLIPANEAAVVLGCTPPVEGHPDLYYTARIQAAAELYHSGRVRQLIVSGTPDQPPVMKADMVALGIPADRITCDNGGYRTLASIIRARDTFGLRSFTIVSQPDHCTRAIYLAHAYGLDVVAFGASDPRHTINIIREYFAHVKAVLDVHILHRDPNYPHPGAPNSPQKHDLD